MSSGLELVSKNPESAVELVDLGVVEVGGVEQPHERTIDELLREAQT